MLTDREINQSQAQIDRALEIAEAKRNARANAGASDIAADHSRRLRSGEYLVMPAREWLKSQLNTALGRWAHVEQTYTAGRPEDQYGKPRALATLELLDGALERLGSRKGAREEVARAWLTEHREKIAHALEAFESLGAALEGPLAVELIERITTSRTALASAHAAKERATRATVEAAILEIEKCAADSREIDRDVAAALAAIHVPEFPSAEQFRDARCNTADLERKPGKNPGVRHIHAAIEEGFRANPAASRLWVVYETKPDHELVKFRARAAAAALEE